jgi:hypothetical protein
MEARPKAWGRAVILYRRGDGSGLYCAVRRGETLPTFLSQARWEVAADPIEPNNVPRGFDVEAARKAVQAMGFYMFEGPPETFKRNRH